MASGSGKVTDGFVADGFEAVRTRFEDNFATGADLGASLCVYQRGNLVVDLWGGRRDEGRSQRWTHDTLALTYSTTKPLVAACALALVDRGALDLDAPVARYWAEFATAGKENITVRHLLSHQAGLVALHESLPPHALFDWERVIAALEKQPPQWQPGTRCGEHALFYGHLIGELVRRIDGRGPRRFFAEEIARPWELDFHIGLADDDLDRAAQTCGMTPEWAAENSGPAGSLRRQALSNPPGALEAKVVNGHAWKTAEIPAVNGYGTARGVARFYEGFLRGGALGGRRLFSSGIVSAATSTQIEGVDALLGDHVRWGLGFQVDPEEFGHGGLGGSVGYASRAVDLSFGYVTNLMADHARADALAAIAEECAARV